MRNIALIVVLLAIAAFGQTAFTPVSPDEAAKHLIANPDPIYPEMARIARIQGKVYIQVTIDEAGKPTPLHIMRGHPMLVDAAINAVKRWRYQPFEVDGKPAAILTTAIVVFDPTGRNTNVAEDYAELAFQQNYSAALLNAQAALDKGDFTESEQQLNKALDLVAPSKRQPFADWQWLNTMGDLRMAQKKYEEAEQRYKEALAVHREDKEAPENAASLASLGNLYTTEKRYDLARDHVGRSVAVYKKNFKRAGSGNAQAQQVYGRAIAYQSWLLSKLALEQTDGADASKQCRTVLEFQKFLNDADREAVVTFCQQTIATPAPKS